MFRNICFAVLLFFVAANAQTQVAYKLYGLDLSPYVNGQNPNVSPQITLDQLTPLVQFVSPYTQWIRSFSSTNGLENIPPLARKIGLKVAATAWIGPDLAQNVAEVTGLINLIASGQVDIAIVGSEALLRNDVSETQLISYMSQVRQAIPSGMSVLVTTADTYSTLLAHPNVIAASDIVAGNFYPYWEGTSIDNAVCSLEQEYQQFATIVAPKKIMISETGWPSNGNAVGAAVPSPANAAQYFSQFTSWAGTNNIPFFYFEAFDESWKALYEGPQGAYWGLWDSSETLKLGMQAVFNGQAQPVTCNGTVGGPGTPAINFTYVPPYGSTDNLEGQVLHVDPSVYRVAVYINVAGGWWTKPTEAQPTVAINRDGTWSAPIVTGGVDQNATAIAAFLVPSSFSPPLLLGASILPSSLTAAAAAQVEIQRTQNSISGTVMDSLNNPIAGATIAGGVLGSATTAPDGKFSFFDIPSSGNVTLTPNYHALVFSPQMSNLNITTGNQRVNFVALPAVDLSIGSVVSTTTLPVGSSFTDTLGISNLGQVGASDAVVTILVPAAFTILSASTSQGACTIGNNQIGCDLRGLGVMATATVILKLTALMAGSFTLGASVSSPDVDANPANNNISVGITVKASNASVVEPPSNVTAVAH